MAWYEVMNGSAESNYNKRLYSILGQKFGLFYFNKKGRIHVFLNTNTRFSFIKQAVEMDPIDAMPPMNHFYVSGNRKDKDYNDEGIEFEEFRDIIEKLKEGQGIMVWFMYYRQKETKDEYVLKEDKFLVKVIITERIDRFEKDQKNSADTQIIALLQNAMKTELYWKEIKGKKNRLYSGKVVAPFPFLIPKKRVMYTYKATIQNFLKLDYSTKEVRETQENLTAEKTDMINFQRDQSPTSMLLDTGTETLMSVVKSAKTAVIYGDESGDQIAMAKNLISIANKNGRNILILNSVRFNAFGTENSSSEPLQFDLPGEYYGHRSVVSQGDSASLADNLWAEMLLKISGMHNPLIIVNNANNVLPVNSSGFPLYESEFWSTFFKHYSASASGISIVFLRTGEVGELGLYVNTVIKTGSDGSEFKVIKS